MGSEMCIRDSKGTETVIGRTGEIRIMDLAKDRLLITNNLPYGSTLLVSEGKKVKKGDVICTWDPYNNVIISEIAGTVRFDNVIEGVTFREEADEQTGHREKVVIDTKDRTKIPSIIIEAKKGGPKSYNLPVGAHIVVEESDAVVAGTVLVKIPRIIGKLRDITGGLPRVTELFEARNPGNPAVVSEIDGVIAFGAVKRGNREISVKARTGEEKKYLIPLSKHILVQDGDFVRAGMQLSDGAISPGDILDLSLIHI